MGKNIKPVLTESFVSTNDLRLKQYYFVKLSADRTVILPTADTDRPIGILQNKPNAGEMAEVMVIGRSPLVSGEALTIGAGVNTGSTGLGEICAAGENTKYNVAHVVEISGAINELANVIVNCANIVRNT